MPDDETAPTEVTVTVRLRADCELVVSSPGTPPHRIVAIRAKRARAAAQRVAELVEEALQARERQGRDGGCLDLTASSGGMSQPSNARREALRPACSGSDSSEERTV